jgi:hypothetical protein
MRTSGIADPDSPETVPEIDPPATCACAAGPQNKSSASVAKMDFMEAPLRHERDSGNQNVSVVLINEINSDRTTTLVIHHIPST